VTDTLLRHGIASTWNDNNEFEIWTKNALAHGFGKPYPAHQAKVLQTLIMMRASRDAQRAYAPDFSIHSWNDDGTVNEPWMHPEATRQVADLIKLRYRLLPYLYHLLWESTQHYDPVLRPTFAEFPQDPRCYVDGDDLMLGASLLFAPVVEPGQTEREVWLPAGARWVSYWSGEAFASDQRVVLPAPWDQPVMLLREGSVIPLNVAQQHFARPADSRGFMVAPHQGSGIARGECFEDDGESQAWRSGEYGCWTVSVASDAATLAVSVDWTGQWRRPFDSIEIFIPAADARHVVTANATIREQTRVEGWTRLILALAGSAA